MLTIPEETRTCGFCGTKFLVRGYLTKTDRKKFCSKDCKHKGLKVHTVAREMSSEEAAWLAGVFDGEGWISWPDPSCITTFRIGVASTSLAFLQRIVEVTGTGRISPRPRPNENHSPIWVWYCFTHNAAILLRQSLPWLIIKRESVEVALGHRQADVAPLTKRGLAQKHTRKSADNS